MTSRYITFFICFSCKKINFTRGVVILSTRGRGGGGGAKPQEKTERPMRVLKGGGGGGGERTETKGQLN